MNKKTLVKTLLCLCTMPMVINMLSGCNSLSQIVPITLPIDSVKTSEELGYAEGSLQKMAKNDATYTANRGSEKGSIIVSSDFSLMINGKNVPVYATPVYVADGNYGALQSFAMVDVVGKKVNMEVEIRVKGIISQSAAVHTATDTVSCQYADGVYCFKAKEYGNYIFVLNGEKEKINQAHSLLLTIRPYADEEKEIEAYKAQYGSENVIVYEEGTHLVDNIHLIKDNSILYLRRGSLLSINHTFDIDSEEDEKRSIEEGAADENGWGLSRRPIINAMGLENVKIVGRGVIDAGKLDWHERRGIFLSSCSRVEIEGITMTNFPEWGLILYCSRDIKIRDVAYFGFRTNSDAFALCNVQNAQVTGCFARTGDDMFEVKTLGSSHMGEDISCNITYDKCMAWGSKARAFGVTGEVEQDIRDITFKNGKVIVRDAIWDNSRVGSLVVIVENGKGNISDITFENIQILYDRGRAVNVGINHFDPCDNRLERIVFKNITYYAEEKGLICSSDIGNNSVSVIVKNGVSKGQIINDNNKETCFEIKGSNASVIIE